MKKATRLLIPYYAFGFIVVAPVMTIFNFTEQTYLKYVVSGIGLARNSRHLWFIFTLFVIFVICAIFKNQIQKWNAFCVFLILLVVSVISQYMPITLSINSVMHYCLFFYLGYVLNKNFEMAVKYSKNPFILLLCTVILVFLCTKGGQLIGIVTAIAGIVLMLGIVQYISSKVFDNKIYRVLNGTSFGVYLFHPMIIYVLFYFFGAMDINPILLCSAIIIASYLISMLATYIVRKIGLGILIGE